MALVLPSCNHYSEEEGNDTNKKTLVLAGVFLIY